MSDVIVKLSLDHVVKALKDVGLPGRLAAQTDLGVPCAVGSRDGLEFVAYIQQGQSLCFQATIPNAVPGFSDVANGWNGWQRLSKVIALQEGYLMRYEVDVSHGVTVGNLRAVARKFGEAVSTFAAMKGGNRP